MSTLPGAVIESAKIDGASHYQTFYRLVLPMSVPGAGVVRDLPVPLGVERPAGRAGLHRPREQRADDRGDHDSLLGQQGQGWDLVTAGGIILDDRPGPRVPRAAALLRPRPDGGLRQGLMDQPAGPRFAHLRAAGSSVLLYLDDYGRLTVEHWGADLGDLTSAVVQERSEPGGGSARTARWTSPAWWGCSRSQSRPTPAVLRCGCTTSLRGRLRTSGPGHLSRRPKRWWRPRRTPRLASACGAGSG